MSIEKQTFILGIGLGVTLGIALICTLILAFGTEESNKLKREAIDHGYALHDPTTGEWMWREEGK